MSTSLLFVGGLAVVILFGFLAGLLFRATRVPDILILMGAGIGIGPHGLGWITPEEIAPSLPAFTTLALLMILFTGGLSMPLKQVLRSAPVATLFTLLVFAGTVMVTALAARHLLGWTMREGWMLGAILGGTSSATVLGLLRGAPCGESCKTLLSLESSITDVLCITVLVAMIQLFTDPAADVSARAFDVGKQFGIGVIAGVVGGLAWGELARRAHRLRLEFMVTLAVVAGVYVGVEYSGGSGAVATLVFGVVMASSRGRVRMPAAISPDAVQAANPDTSQEVTRELRSFHDELAFLLRTLFFIVLGVRFPVENPGLTIWLGLAAILIGWAVVRWVIVLPISPLSRLDRRDRFITVHLFPRGMVAAVLAALPAQYLMPDGTALITSARAADFVLVTFLVVGLTTVWSSVAVLFAGSVPAQRASVEPSRTPSAR